MKSPDELTEAFRRRGLKVTPQRQSIFRALHGNPEHPTAESVYDAVRTEMPTISLRTVYQTLNDLAAMGELRQLSFGHRLGPLRPERRRRTTTWCATAAARSSTSTPTPPASRLPPADRQGFTVTATQVVFRGLCAECVGSPTIHLINPISNQPARGDHPCLISRAARPRPTSRRRSPARARPTAATSTSPRRPTSRATPTSPRCSARSPRARPGHAFGHFDFLAEVGDPVTDVPVGPTADNLKSAITGETYEYTEMYPGFSKTARDEGFEDIAEWLETLARAEKSHAGRFTQGLEALDPDRTPIAPSGWRGHGGRADPTLPRPEPTMTKLTIDDISDLRAYERERAEFRADVIALKKRRRVHVGPVVTLRVREPRHHPLPDPGDGPGREAHQRRGHRDRARHLQPAHPRAGLAVGHAVHRADQRGRSCASGCPSWSASSSQVELRIGRRCRRAGGALRRRPRPRQAAHPRRDHRVGALRPLGASRPTRSTRSPGAGGAGDHPPRLRARHRRWRTRPGPSCCATSAGAERRWGSRDGGLDHRAGFDAALEAAAGHARRYLATIDDRPVGATASLAELRARLGGELNDAPIDAATVVDELVAAVDGGLVATGSPRYFGFVIGGSLPAALAADWLTSAWDQNAGLYAGGPAAAVIEEVVGRWVLDLLGLPADVSFGLVTGCQMAHVTVPGRRPPPRARRRGWDVERQGLAGAPPVRVLAGAERARTVDRALRAARHRDRRVDARGRRRPGPHAARRAAPPRWPPASGPTIVCAQVGEVNTGAIDPVAEMCDVVAAGVGAWVHVDGAFGLWAAASPTRRHLVAGVERADSWATDAHKWLNVPYDCGHRARAPTPTTTAPP